MVLPEKQAADNGNGHGTHQFDPAAWKGQVDALIEVLPDGLRKPMGNAVGQVLFTHIGGTKPCERFVLHTELECLADIPPIRWRVENFISAGSVNVIAGAAKVGKTFAVFDMAVAVSRGEDWLGLKTNKCNVLIIDEESGTQRMFRRLGDALRGHSTGAGSGIQFVTLACVDLTVAADIAALEALIEETGAGLVILDALIDMLGDADENSNTEVQKIFLALRALAERTDAAFVVLHHHGKAGGYRGASAISGAIDMLCNLSKNDHRLDFEAALVRDSDASSFGAVMNFGEGTFNLSPSASIPSRVKFNPRELFVLRYLQEHNGQALTVDMGEYAEHHEVNMTAKQVSNAVTKLSENGYIERADDGGRGVKATVRLTAKGHDAHA